MLAMLQQNSSRQVQRQEQQQEQGCQQLSGVLCSSGRIGLNR
jgi:hypothetical protein